MTPLQLKLIHIARRQVDLNEEQYRTLLHNVAGVESSRDLSNYDFEDVMAVLEDLGFRDTSGDPERWRRKVRMRGQKGNERMIFKIRQLHAQGQCRYPLDSLARQFSGNRADQVEQLRPREAWGLIEMLKDLAEREAKEPVELLPF